MPQHCQEDAGQKKTQGFRGLGFRVDDNTRATDVRQHEARAFCPTCCVSTGAARLCSCERRDRKREGIWVRWRWGRLVYRSSSML